MILSQKQWAAVRVRCEECIKNAGEEPEDATAIREYAQRATEWQWNTHWRPHVSLKASVEAGFTYGSIFRNMYHQAICGSESWTPEAIAALKQYPNHPNKIPRLQDDALPSLLRKAGFDDLDSFTEAYAGRDFYKAAPAVWANRRGSDWVLKAFEVDNTLSRQGRTVQVTLEDRHADENRQKPPKLYQSSYHFDDNAKVEQFRQRVEERLAKERDRLDFCDGLFNDVRWARDGPRVPVLVKAASVSPLPSPKVPPMFRGWKMKAFEVASHPENGTEVTIRLVLYGAFDKRIAVPEQRVFNLALQDDSIIEALRDRILLRLAQAPNAPSTLPGIEADIRQAQKRERNAAGNLTHTRDGWTERGHLVERPPSGRSATR